jgi:hypothetical protein
MVILVFRVSITWIHAFVRGIPPRAMLRVAAQRLAKRAAPQWGAAARPALVPFARAYADDANLLKTALYDFHLEMGGKMVRPRRSPRGNDDSRRPALRVSRREPSFANPPS